MQTVKTCPSCGAENDILLTNCLYCKTSLPKVDFDSISNETLIMNAGEWVGKVGTKYIHQTENYNEWNGKGRIIISANQIEGIAQKYMSLLQVRSINNQHISLIYSDLRKELNDKRKGLVYKLGGGDKHMGAFFLTMICFMIFMILMALVTLH